MKFAGESTNRTSTEGGGKVTLLTQEYPLDLKTVAAAEKCAVAQRLLFDGGLKSAVV